MHTLTLIIIDNTPGGGRGGRVASHKWANGDVSLDGVAFSPVD